MKQFSCGDVVPGCKAVFQADHEETILSLVAEHAKADHAMAQVPPAIVDQVRSHILEISPAAA